MLIAESTRETVFDQIRYETMVAAEKLRTLEQRNKHIKKLICKMVTNEPYYENYNDLVSLNMTQSSFGQVPQSQNVKDFLAQAQSSTG